jgi:hypothetical protein
VRRFRSHVLLTGLLVFTVSGAEGLVPPILHLSQPSSCPACSMRNCHCRTRCCGTGRCTRLAGTHERGHAARQAAADTRNQPAWGSTCSSAEEAAIADSTGSRPAVVTAVIVVIRPGSRETTFEPSLERYVETYKVPLIPPPESHL